MHIQFRIWLLPAVEELTVLFLAVAAVEDYQIQQLL
jgi:hypothetical protein